MDALTAIGKLLDAGILEVRPNGEIWKLAIRDSHQNVRPITPKRAENLMNHGYLGVKVEWQGKPYLATAHRVVWTRLIGAIPPGMDLNHIDGVKTNNHPSNLELATRKENIMHSIRTGLAPKRGFSHARLADLTPKAKALKADGLSFREIGEKLGVSQTSAFRLAKSPPS